MDFIEALRIVFDLANGCEITLDEADCDEEREQAIAQSDALDTIQNFLECPCGAHRRR